jgi:aminobenzoyl-glutamate utilization protein B
MKELWEIGNKMAEGAALMTNTKWTSRILGTAYPQHMNKTVAETMYENIQKVGLPSGARPTRRWPRALQKDWATHAARTGDEARELAAPSGSRTTWAAAPTTSATSRGTCRR